MSRSVVRTVGLLTRSQKTLSRHISLSSRQFDKDKKDEFDPSKFFKDVKPREIGVMEEYREKIKMENPISRCGKVLKNDMKFVGHKIKKFIGFEDEMSHDLRAQFFPTHTDVLIIGGGAMGSSIAYWLKQRAPHGMHVTVVEKDVSYAEASTVLSVGGLRQQFSLPENVDMSLFGAEFLRNLGKRLSIDGMQAPDAQFQPHGYLFLASEEGAATLQENSEMQCKMGARNILLSADKLKERFPWLNTEGVELGCLGLENEGWFDPWSLLNALKQKSINLGAEYVQGNMVGFEFKYQPHIQAPSKDDRYEQLERVILEMPNGDIRAIKFAYCIIAAGANSGEIAKMARIGEAEGKYLILPLNNARKCLLFKLPV